MSNDSYKPHEFAALIGKSVLTLQRWDREGKLRAMRTETNRRYYTKQQYLEYKGVHALVNSSIVAYCRASCALQSDDIQLQRELIDNYAQSCGVEISHWYIDHNSSLNYQREQFNQLLEQIEMGKVKTLFLAHKDRLVRFGYEWFASFCNRHGTEIKLVSHSEWTPDKHELINELKLIINIFSGKVVELNMNKDLILQVINKVENMLDNAAEQR
ncbi:MAG: IS607 family transposase [Neisseriaceae bacterium]|nr:MAG: IS607 family transposase [Neisseriaceae bacterium]